MEDKSFLHGTDSVVVLLVWVRLDHKDRGEFYSCQ